MEVGDVSEKRSRVCSAILIKYSKVIIIIINIPLNIKSYE